MHALPLIPSAATSEPTWSDAVVDSVLDAERCLLDDGRVAKRAASCLLQLLPGDRVLVAAVAAGERHVVHVLERSAAADASLSVAGAPTLALRAPAVSLEATSRVALRSLGDVDVTAAAGSLNLQARNVFTHAADAIVQHAEHWVGRLGHAMLEARQLLRLHGQHTIVTAAKDVKIDGERISMG